MALADLIARAGGVCAGFTAKRGTAVRVTSKAGSKARGS